MQYRHPHFESFEVFPRILTDHQMVIMESKCFQGSTVTSFLLIQYWLCISSILLVTVPNMVWLWTVSSFLPSGYDSKPLQIVEHPENSRLSTCLHTFRDFEPCFEPYFGRQSMMTSTTYRTHMTLMYPDVGWFAQYDPMYIILYIYIYI